MLYKSLSVGLALASAAAAPADRRLHASGTLGDYHANAHEKEWYSHNVDYRCSDHTLHGTYIGAEPTIALKDDNSALPEVPTAVYFINGAQRARFDGMGAVSGEALLTILGVPRCIPSPDAPCNDGDPIRVTFEGTYHVDAMCNGHIEVTHLHSDGVDIRPTALQGKNAIMVSPDGASYEAITNSVIDGAVGASTLHRGSSEGHCTVKDVKGTYMGSDLGFVLNDGSARPSAGINKVVADGDGHFMLQGTGSVLCPTRGNPLCYGQVTLKGSYEVSDDCHVEFTTLDPEDPLRVDNHAHGLLTKAGDRIEVVSITPWDGSASSEDSLHRVAD